MDFEEFLMATSPQGLIDEIYKCYNEMTPMSNPLHEKLLNLYRLYLCVGGMPQAVQNFNSTEKAKIEAISSTLVYKCNLLKTIQIPPKAYADEEYFKLYISDVGLLTSLLEIQYNEILLDSKFLYKGNIVENYVAQNLVRNGISLYYWKSNSDAEIDFILYNEDGLIPVEVKASDNTTSKSLNSYVKQYNPKYSIRVSTKNFGFENNIKSIPLYAIFLIK